MRKSPHSRFPVIDQGGRVRGIVSLLEAVLAPDATTEELTHPAASFERNTPLRKALATLRSRRETMAVIVAEQTGEPLGLVTLKDLVEPLTGELAAW